MAYKITFDKDRNAVYKWSHDEQQSVLWKKGPLLDEFIIKPTGRNIRSKPFRHHVIYTVYDYWFQQKRKAPLQITVICDTKDNSGTAIDVTIQPYKYWKYELRYEIDDTLKAIIAADQQYSKIGGGVMYFKNPLHRNPELVKKLKKLLEEIKQK